jgi:hypothetical protein
MLWSFRIITHPHRKPKLSPQQVNWRPQIKGHRVPTPHSTHSAGVPPKVLASWLAPIGFRTNPGDNPSQAQEGEEVKGWGRIVSSKLSLREKPRREEEARGK